MGQLGTGLGTPIDGGKKKSPFLRRNKNHSQKSRKKYHKRHRPLKDNPPKPDKRKSTIFQFYKKGELMAVNQVNLIGRLTRDPELRHLASGSVVTEWGIAVPEKYKRQDGTWCEEAVFVDLVSWGKLAGTVAQYLKKGQRVHITGKLKLDMWVDQRSGQNRQKLKVIATAIEFLEKREGSASQQSQQQSYTDSASQAPQSQAYWGEEDEPPF